MITLPDGKICNNLPEQVAKNAKDILEIAAQWQPYKDQLEADFEILAGLIEDMSTAAVAALAGQDVSVKTISQTNPNASFGFEITGNAGLLATNVYNRCEVINNILYVIVNVVLYNGTGAAVSPQYLGGVTINLGSEIASKVFDFNGNNATGNGGNAWITGERALIKENTGGTAPTSYATKSGATVHIDLQNSNAANSVALSIAGSSAISIGNGYYVFVSGRIALTLL